MVAHKVIPSMIVSSKLRMDNKSLAYIAHVQRMYFRMYLLCIDGNGNKILICTLPRSKMTKVLLISSQWFLWRYLNCYWLWRSCYLYSVHICVFLSYSLSWCVPYNHLDYIWSHHADSTLCFVLLNIFNMHHWALKCSYRKIKLGKSCQYIVAKYWLDVQTILYVGNRFGLRLKFCRRFHLKFR